MQRTTIFLLLLLSAFTLNNYVRGAAEFLGLPMIILNCTTNYTTPARSINITWLLNSTLPADVKHDGFSRVVTCRTNIACGNGHTDKNDYCRRQYGWKFDDIPITERFCNVTVEYVDFALLNNVYYANSTLCSFSDDFNTTIDIQDVTENRTVGDPHEVQCEVYNNEVLNTSITWIGPNNDTIVTNNRIIVNATISADNNHTSTLRFLYLTEEDQGSYNCHVTILNNYTDSKSFKLDDFTIPIPDVNVAILNSKNTVGSELSLGCNVTTVMGVSSSVEIVWIKNGTIVEETSDGRIRIFINDNVHTSILQFLYLSEDDESDYTCNAMIRDTGNSKTIKLNNFDIPNPSVSVTAVNQNVGDPLSLKCNVSIVTGITSDVYITWMANGNELKHYNGNVMENTTAYTYYYNGTEELTLNDNNTMYQCQVTINNRSMENDNLTLNVIGRASTSAPSDETFSTAAIISIISITIALIFLCFVVFIGIYMYRAKRYKKLQVSRDHVSRDHEFEPFDDSGFSVIGKDAPSTCESLSTNQKIKDWMKSFQMSDIDEECESVISATNEDMLNFVHGHTKKATQIDDSGVSDSEVDSGLSLSKQNTYIPHKAIEDMHYGKIDERNQPNHQDVVTVDSVHMNGNHIVVAHGPANSSSAKSNSNFLGQSVTSPSTGDSYPFLATGENYNGRQQLSYSADTGSGSYVDHYVTSNNDIDPPLHSTNENTLTTAVSGSYVDHNATSISQPLLHSNTTTATNNESYVDPYVASKYSNNPVPLLNSTTSTTAVDGSYIDHDATSNSQSLSHSNTSTTADEGSYIDHYIASNNDSDNPVPLLHSTTSTTAVDGSYIDHDATSNSQPLSHSNTSTTADEGSYVDHYVASNNDNSNPLHSTNSGITTTAVDGSYVDHDTTSKFHSTLHTPLIKNMSGYTTESDV